MSEQAKVWTKEAIEEFLSREDVAYQKIELPYGLSTTGTSRPELLDIALGSDLKGQSVLDVGSYLGYLCLEACARGAERVVGVEVDALRVKQARTLAEIKGMRPEYKLGDIEVIDQTERFDVVLCLNVLHHLFDPIGALHKLSRLTRRTLVLEVATFGRHDRPKFGLPAWFLSKLSKESVILVGTGVPNASRRATSQKYFFSQKSLIAILANHTKVFARVEAIPSGFKDRFIIKATRRQVGHLVIVTGPTSSGKSSFLDGLKTGAHSSALRAKLPADIASWPQIGANAFLGTGRTVDGKLLSDEPLPGLVLHYDFLRPYTTGTHDFYRDQALDLIACASKLTVVTLKPTVEQLTAQLVKGELGGVIPVSGKKKKTPPTLRRKAEKVLKKWLPQGLKSLLKAMFGAQGGGSGSAQHEALFLRYQEQGWVGHWYDEWASYLNGLELNTHSIVVEPDPDAAFQWREKA